jgi:hypothetical protein
MTSHTNPGTTPLAISRQISERLRIGIFLSSCELLAYLSLKLIAKELLYVGIFAITTIMVMSMPKLFGPGKLLADMRDLCLFDVAAAVFGQTLYVLGYDASLWLIVATAISVLKAMRLWWPVKTADRRDFAGWPVFGLFSFLYARQQVQQHLSQKMVMWNRTTLLAYFCMVVSLLIGAILANHFMLQLALWGILPMMYLFMSAPKNGSGDTSNDNTPKAAAKTFTGVTRPQIEQKPATSVDTSPLGPLSGAEEKLVRVYRRIDPAKRFYLYNAAAALAEKMPNLTPTEK